VIPLTLADVAEAVGGRLAAGTDPAQVVTLVVADSRQVRPGALFVALPGDRVDGHDFVVSASGAGAVAVLAGREVGAPAVLVDDPLVALGRLARAVVDRLRGQAGSRGQAGLRGQAGSRGQDPSGGQGVPGGLTIVGLTGSSGKTTTKDLLAGLLRRLGPTVAPQGSFNNELGLPLTALAADRATAYLIAEMGARGVGHLQYLCGITPPQIGVVLNVGAAHAGEFGSREVTAQAKGELVEALPARGVDVLNADDPQVRAMASRTAARVVLFGRAGDADIRAADITLDDRARARFRLVTGDGEAPVALRLHGAHQVGNAVAAAAVALAAGLGIDAVAAGLGEAGAASRWRMEVTARPDGIVVVNDAYNANPDSVAAALEALAAITPPAAAAHRRWAVLGEMLELGGRSPAEHAGIGARAARLGVDRMVAVGAGAGPYVDGFTAAGPLPGAIGRVAADVPAALALLRAELAPGDVVLIKASRAIGLDRLAAQLLVDALGPTGGAS
jgi:UDP-N-acetylmuramoyl-tripeptide--D-alanyl-D-alanine ligase